MRVRCNSKKCWPLLRLSIFLNFVFMLLWNLFVEPFRGTLLWNPFVEPPAAFVEPPGAFVEPLCGKHVPQSRFHDARVHFFGCDWTEINKKFLNFGTLLLRPSIYYFFGGRS